MQEQVPESNFIFRKYLRRQSDVIRHKPAAIACLMNQFLMDHWSWVTLRVVCCWLFLVSLTLGELNVSRWVADQLRDLLVGSFFFFPPHTFCHCQSVSAKPKETAVFHSIGWCWVVSAFLRYYHKHFTSFWNVKSFLKSAFEYFVTLFWPFSSNINVHD